MAGLAALCGVKAAERPWKVNFTAARTAIDLAGWKQARDAAIERELTWADARYGVYNAETNTIAYFTEKHEPVRLPLYAGQSGAFLEEGRMYVIPDVYRGIKI